MAARALRPDRTPNHRRRRATAWRGPSALARAAAIAGLAVLALFAPVPADAQEAPGAGEPVEALGGDYFGIGGARGMRLSLEAARDPSGRFVDSNGVETEIGGGWREGGLEALLNFPRRAVYARFEPAGLGLQMTVIPIDGEGRPRPEQARVLAFLRDGATVPEAPELYTPPPARSDGESDPDVFLASYQFWPAEGVANGFSQIGARYRTMIRLFPQVHADVLWKLCEADGRRARELVAEALRGQGATCADIEALLERLTESGRFPEWKAEVERAIDRLLPSVQCARGYIVREDVCAPAAQRMAEAAVSMETLGTLMARWR